MDKYPFAFGGVEKKCPVCHKTYTVLYPELWAYKDEYRYFCSWHCLRAAEKPVDPSILRQLSETECGAIGGDPGRPFVRITPEDKQRIIELRKLGFNSRQIAEQIGISKTSVCDICKKAGMPYKHYSRPKKGEL
jgi:hypothetical protein